MGLTENNLIPSDKTVRIVGGFTMTCRGWLPMFDVQGRQTKQALYICDKVDWVYFSRSACLDVGILPASFPHPMSASELDEVHASFPDVGPVCPSSHMSPVVDPLCLPVVPFNPKLFDTLPQDCTDGNHPSAISPGPNVQTHPVVTCEQVPSTKLSANLMSPAPEAITQVTDAGPPTGPASAVLEVPYPVSSAHDPDRWLPVRPTEIPFEPIEENMGRLKQYLLDAFEGSTFNTEGKFPKLHGPDGHIHLQSNAVSKARHSPIPVTFHLKETMKASLFRDVERGIIAPVPVGTPTEWCSTMVVTAKKDGRPRRTIDYQHLNSQCLRETHHTGSPFHLALQVPAGSKKTVLDSMDGYHSVPLDVESQHLTTFITEWGRFMYLRMPQSYLASGDAYIRRYDDIIKDVPRKVKCVDDVLLHDDGIEESFYHTSDYLMLCAKNGVVKSHAKFQFCQDDVEFDAILTLTKSGVAPLKSMLSAIEGFPTSGNITDVRSWFGLVNQVAWAYSLGPVMQPFRDLLRPSSRFYWDEQLNEAFEKSKSQVVTLVREGIATFQVMSIAQPVLSQIGAKMVWAFFSCKSTVTVRMTMLLHVVQMVGVWFLQGVELAHRLRPGMLPSKVKLLLLHGLLKRDVCSLLVRRFDCHNWPRPIGWYSRGSGSQQNCKSQVVQV